MKQQKLLIFGAGINQLSLIDACNGLGYTSVVIDPGINPPGKDLAHIFEPIPADDYEKTKAVAINYGVNGIATSQMENPLRMMARLADELGFRFNPPEIIEQSLNKYLMKQVFIKNGVPHAKGIHFKGKDRLTKTDLKGMEFPLIIKPVDSHSSRGVYKVDSLDQLLQYVEETISFSKTASYLVEEFIEGPEYSIETVTFKNKTTIIQLTEKIITPFPNVVELGHIQPATLTGQQKNAISNVVVEAIRALGLNNTVCHTEVKLSPNGPIVIEVGPRMGGDFISSYLVKHSCGIDLDEATIQMALGYTPDLKPKLSRFSCIRYLQLDAGRKVKSLGNWKKVLESPNVVFANVNIREGDTVPKITDSAKRPGFVIVKGEDRSEVTRIADSRLSDISKGIEYY